MATREQRTPGQSDRRSPFFPHRHLHPIASTVVPHRRLDPEIPEFLQRPAALVVRQPSPASSASTSAKKMKTQSEEKHGQLSRILYEKQPFPDNYVDDSFLKELRKNVNIRTYGTTEAIIEVGVVSQEICSVTLFAAAFVFLDDGRLQPQALLFATLVGALVLYGGHLCFLKKRTTTTTGSWWTPQASMLRQVAADGKLAAVYLILNFAFSPVLKTLTETISSDTVYAMATASMVVHLVTHDYGPSFPLVSSPLSFNAALFGVVCLASRLPDSLSTFALLTAAVEMFALLPHFRRRLRANCGSVGRTSVTGLAVCATVAVLFVLSPSLAVCFLLAVAFVNVLCPIWFVRLQKYKENLYGPWDEAVLKPS